MYYCTYCNKKIYGHPSFFCDPCVLRVGYRGEMCGECVKTKKKHINYVYDNPPEKMEVRTATCCEGCEKKLQRTNLIYCDCKHL